MRNRLLIVTGFFILGRLLTAVFDIENVGWVYWLGFTLGSLSETAVVVVERLNSEKPK